MRNKPGRSSFQRDVRERVCGSGPAPGDLQRSLLAWGWVFSPCCDEAMAALPSTCCHLSGRSGQETAARCPGNGHCSQP